MYLIDSFCLSAYKALLPAKFDIKQYAMLLTGPYVVFDYLCAFNLTNFHLPAAYCGGVGIISGGNSVTISNCNFTSNAAVSCT